MHLVLDCALFANTQCHNICATYDFHPCTQFILQTFHDATLNTLWNASGSIAGVIVAFKSCSNVTTHTSSIPSSVLLKWEIIILCAHCWQGLSISLIRYPIALLHPSICDPICCCIIMYVVLVFRTDWVIIALLSQFKLHASCWVWVEDCFCRLFFIHLVNANFFPSSLSSIFFQLVPHPSFCPQYVLTSQYLYLIEMRCADLWYFWNL